MPVINLDKDTSKEGVCTVFEKVNTGGVVLTVFELLTASLAADGFSLRDDWQAMLDLIGKAMGKQITGGQESFWAALASAGFTKPPEVAAPSEVEFDTDDITDEIEFDELGEAAYAEEQLATND